MTVLWTLILAPFLIAGVLPLGPFLGIAGAWFLFAGIKECCKDQNYTDDLVFDVIFYIVPGVILLVVALSVGNQGLLDLLF